TATVPAYDGQNITVTVTVDENGNVATLAVDASTQTPGLGQKCAEAEFVNQFIGQAGPFVLGENVDAVSYATITSDAVVQAVNSVLGK
ncbi:MAG: FMN-binding protein, partial [Clostridia bacterium]|nr:FMN-binding protein [Clostridia bacterium]